MSVSVTERDFYDMRNQRDQEREKVIKQAVELARLTVQVADLTGGNEKMQEDAVQNTYAFNIMLEADKSQAAEIAALKTALIKISKTTVTMGDSKSAFIMWRACCTTANDALKG
jgi:hypothetical protein